MIFFAFLGALSLSVLAFELLSVFQNAFNTFGSNRLINVSSSTPKRRSTWEALLIAILPRRFDPQQARNMTDVISLLRRAGYPYDTPGEFYAVAIRDFTLFLAMGGILAGALAALNMLAVAPVVALIFIFLGLRRPYVRLKNLAKKHAESLRNNMLIGLSVLSALLSSGVGVQEALRRTSSVGGPFCNLLPYWWHAWKSRTSQRRLRSRALICPIRPMWRLICSCAISTISLPTIARCCPASRACRNPYIAPWWR
jgi:Flp pilus assembly protein TadB